MRFDPDDLAASALAHDGEPAVEPSDPRDRTTLQLDRRVVALGRSIAAEDRERFDPPDDLWDRISAELSDAGRRSGTITGAGTGPSATASAPGGAEVVDLASRRRSPRILAAAAAVVLLIVGAVGIGLNRQGGTELVASTDLELLAGGGSGSAELVRESDGMHLRVDVSDLSAAERADFFELWLLTPDGKDPQSLTKFDSTSGVIDVRLPAGMSTTEFPVVDISEEVDDGDTSHSGKSILRGSLQ